MPRRSLLHATLALTLLSALTSCRGPLLAHDDAEVLRAEPVLLQESGAFAVRLVTREGNLRPGSIETKVEGDHLLLFVPVFLSIGTDDAVVEYPVRIPGRFRNQDLDGRVFWLDPDGTQFPLEILREEFAEAVPASATRSR